jgi:hypothetical protein
MICPKCKKENTFFPTNETFENQNVLNCFICSDCNCIVTKNNDNEISNIYYDLYLFPD